MTPEEIAAKIAAKNAELIAYYGPSGALDAKEIDMMSKPEYWEAQEPTMDPIPEFDPEYNPPIDHTRSNYPCTKCGATRINTLFFVDGMPYFMHTCVCCDAPSEEATD